MNSATVRGLRGATQRWALPPSAAWARPVAVQKAVLQPWFARPASSLPTIAQADFWKAVIPKAIWRRLDGSSRRHSKKVKSKDWNPATFYIVIFLFIGSMAIQMITLKKQFANFMRQSEAKIAVLREVVERIQKGEDVDVERALGTGNLAAEAEWEAALREIERHDVSRALKRQEKKAAKSAAAAAAAVPTPDSETVSPVPDEATGPNTAKVASITSFY